MLTEKGNYLRVPFATYQKRYIKQLVKQLTPGQRAELKELLGADTDEELVKVALTVAGGK